MASMGLLGAIGGLGDALQTAGTNLATRRERALEQARQLAAEERKRAQQLQDKKEERLFTLSRDDALESRRDARTAAQIASQEGRAELAANTRRETTEAQISSRERVAEANREAAKEVARLRASLDADKDARQARLQKALSAKDVQGVQYGPAHPRDPDYRKVILVKKDGTIEETNQYAFKPKRQNALADEDF